MAIINQIVHSGTMFIAVKGVIAAIHDTAGIFLFKARLILEFFTALTAALTIYMIHALATICSAAGERLVRARRNPKF